MNQEQLARLAALEEAIKDLPKKEEIGKMVEDAMIVALENAGRRTKSIILTLAVVIGAIAVITGGVKGVLAFFGFAVTRQ